MNPSVAILAQAIDSLYCCCRFANFCKMAELYSAAVVAEGNVILSKDGHVPVLTILKDFSKFLVRSGIGYCITAHSDVVLCHPANRGGLGLHGRNAHANGARVHAVGANIDELHGAWAVEMSGDARKRAEQIRFNERQVELSDGMLAPVTGRERYISLGCGHMTAFCRAANYGCRIEWKHVPDTIVFRLELLL